MTLSIRYELCSPLWLMSSTPNVFPNAPHFLLAATISAGNGLRLLFHLSETIRHLLYESEPLIMGGSRSFWHPGERAVVKRGHVCQLFGFMHKTLQMEKKKKRWKSVSRADNGAVVKNAACGGSKLKWFGKRWQLPRLDLRSYQAEVCWRCNTWSLLAPLWQRTGLDHWRWLGGLWDRDVGGL